MQTKSSGGVESSVSSQSLKSAQSLKDQLVKIRREIHSNPELSFQESKTAALVAAELTAIGLKPKTGVGGTGVTVEIGPGAGPTLLVRCDMDALPIEEANNASYCSKNIGVMHACGHDMHTTCGIGAAMLLKNNPPKKGLIRFLFQPAEESINAEGKSGATMMLEDGAGEGANGVIGLHVFPNLPVGTVAVRSGPVLAACDSFEITIHGTGSHGAFPELGVDPLVLASHAIQSVQTIVSRRRSALDPLVVTLGGIKSSTYRPNIVPEHVEITGTARYFNPELSAFVQEELKRALSVVEAFGGRYDLKYHCENPALVNDVKLSETVKTVASKMLGNDCVAEAPMVMGADDFSFMSAKHPGCYFFLGVMMPDGIRSLHTPTFDANEDALPYGAALLAECAREFVENSAPN